MYSCKICANESNNILLTTREMMFGLREEFTYLECGNCGCIQLVEVPSNMGKYYPPNYYSLSKARFSFLEKYMRRIRGTHALGKKSLIGHLIVKKFGPPPFVEWTRRVGMGCNASILDVGCGSGDLLLTMHYAGFTNLMGIDPYIKEDIYYEVENIRILKRDLKEIEEQYDLIMMHHVFEHLLDPLEILRKGHSILKNGGYLLIRTPIADSYAKKVYENDWIQLDAPRHIFIQTRKSMEALAQAAGFKIEAAICDSKSIQFWGSEQYKKNIPLHDRKSFYINPDGSIFSKKDIIRFNKKAKELNNSNNGDQVCFYLRK